MTLVCNCSCNKMFNTRFFVVILLFAGATQISGDNAIVRKDIKGRLLTPSEGCGISNTVNTRIVGGTTAIPGAWPWMALFGRVYSEYFKVYLFSCGGSLITSRHVLSAAHCFKITYDFVRFGEHNTLQVEDGNRADVPIKRVDIHEDYIRVPKINDIAIVHLARDVEFTDRIRPICLPTSKELQRLSFVGKMPYVAGWGRLSEKQNGMTNILQQVQLPVIGNNECKNIYEDAGRFTTGLEYRFNESYVLCAGYTEGGKDACQGDSGGPLFLPIQEGGRFSYHQIGVVSYGDGCGRPNMPGVYTNVKKYSDWILKKLK